jgi:NitT/TauT family transport system substrate-binding protein
MAHDNLNRREILKRGGAAVTAGFLAGCSGGQGGGGETPTIRYSLVSGTETIDVTGMFYQSETIREDVLENVGESYELEIQQAQGTPGVVTALGSDEADAGVLAYSSLANAVANDAISGGASVVAPYKWQTETTPDGIYARADTDIETGADLEGKEIAVPAVGTASDLLLRAALANTAGLDPENDVTIREVSFGAMPAALEEDRVQAASMIQPFIYLMGDSINRVFEPTAGIGTHLVVFAGARNDFAEANSEAMRGWLEDLWTGVQWWTDDANREEAVDIATDVIGLDRPVMDALVQTDRGYYQGEDGFGIAPPCLQRGFDVMEEIGFLDESLTASDHLDNSYLPEEAQTVSVNCE